MRPFAVSTSATCREDITTATLLTDSWLLTCADGLVAYDMRQGDRRGADLDHEPPAAGVPRRDPGPAVDRRGADLDQGPPAAGVLRRDTGPAADRRGAELDLVDYTYDGAVVDGGTRLVGGLGQLTDGDQARHIQF